jgi:hypothetical protein
MMSGSHRSAKDTDSSAGGQTFLVLTVVSWLAATVLSHWGLVSLPILNP